MRDATVQVKCACGQDFAARVADRKRGWAKSCSKSCAATRTNKKTGNYQRYMSGQRNFRGSGVSREVYIKYANEFGGTPQFNHRTGEYEGFTAGFSNEEHDCNKDWD